MTIEFRQIFEFINKNILWFIIPINILILALLTITIIKYIQLRKKRKEHERRAKDKLSRNAKKRH